MSILKNTTIIIAIKWSIVPLQFFTDVMLARTLGAEGKGVLLLLTGLLAVLVTLFGLGLPNAAAYFYKNEQYSLGNILAVCLIFTMLSIIGVAIAFFFFTDGFIKFFMGQVENLVVQSIWLWLTIATMAPGLLSPLADVLLMVEGDMKLYSLKTVGTALVRISSIWLLVVILQWGVIGTLLGQLLALLFALGVFVYWIGKKKAFTNLKLSLVASKDILLIGLQQYGISVVALIAKRLDTFLIAGMLTLRDVGYYSIAFSLINLFVDVPRSTMWPMVSVLSEKNQTSSIDQFAMVTRFMVALMSVLMIGVAFILPWIIPLLYGKEFLPAIEVIWAILPASIFAVLIVTGSAYLTSIGRMGDLFLPIIAATLLQVITSLFFMPHIGAVGNSLGFTVNQMVTALFCLYFIHRYTWIRYRNLLFFSKTDTKRMISTFKAYLCKV